MPTPPLSHVQILELLRECKEEISWMAERAEARLRHAEGLDGAQKFSAWREREGSTAVTPAGGFNEPATPAGYDFAFDIASSRETTSFGVRRLSAVGAKDLAEGAAKELAPEEVVSGVVHWNEKPTTDTGLSNRIKDWKAEFELDDSAALEGNGPRSLSKFTVDRQSIISTHLEKAVKSREPFLTRLVSSKAFNVGLGLLVFSNAVFMGVQVDYGNMPEHSLPLLIGSVIFTCLFVLELLLRFLGEGCSFWLAEPPWNIIDTMVTACSVVELSLRLALGDLNGGGGNISLFRTLRMLRFVRAARVLRVMHFFRELRLMVISIMHSLQSIVWALGLLLMTTFMFGISVAQGVKDANPTEFSEHLMSQLRLRFGSVALTMLTFFQSVLGGFSWAELTDMLREVGWMYEFLFCSFVAFTVLALLNVVTGVFVDGALQSAAQDRDIAIQDQILRDSSYAQELRRLFEEADVDESGSLSLHEFLQYLRDDRVQSYLRCLGINPTEAEEVFHLLDLDDSGYIDIEEFIAGCLRFKGEAKGIDVFMLMYENKRMVLGIISALEAIAAEVTIMRTSQSAVGSICRKLNKGLLPAATRCRRARSPKSLSVLSPGRGSMSQTLGSVTVQSMLSAKCSVASGKSSLL